MSSIKRVSLVATLALAAVALTAGPASADIVEFGTSNVYEDVVAGVNSGDDPTLETDQVTIVCGVATVDGEITEGNTPATAELDFGWDDCNIVGGVGCNVDPIENVSVDLDESPAAPDSTIINTELGATFISCALVFNCTASSDPTDGSGLTDSGGTGSEVTAPTTGAADPVSNIDDTVVVDGPTCPETGQWVAEYTITVPSGGLESNN